MESIFKGKTEEFYSSVFPLKILSIFFLPNSKIKTIKLKPNN
jgi:hypothetical protein